MPKQIEVYVDVCVDISNVTIFKWDDVLIQIPTHIDICA